MISFENIVKWIQAFLNAHLPHIWVLAVETVIIIIAAIALFAVLGLVLVIMERRVAAFMQIRFGPNRVGPWGLLRSTADTIKLIMKESIVPDNSDKFLFNLAPFMVMIPAMLILAPINFAKHFFIWDLNIGILFVSSVSSISVIGILMGGWASSNKYSLHGAMRSGAQIVSYELSGGLSILTIIVLCGSLKVSDIITAQETGWWIFRGHIPAIIAFVIYMIAVTAETNRAPFDLAEAESELTAGFHTEYSGMRFALFFLAEYINIFIVCAVGATLFFGGWMPFHIGTWHAFNHIMDFIPSSIWFFGKTFFLIFLIMWFRWTFPRLRIDQLLNLEWKYLMPISMVNLLVMTVCAIYHLHF